MLLLQVHALGEILPHHHLPALSHESVDLIHVIFIRVVVYLLLLIVPAATAHIPLQELRRGVYLVRLVHFYCYFFTIDIIIISP